ncbi:LLM class flavin-dependent oxidoreductase [Kibdelosporangium persicum]|uniref:LLM class flavin-dependent oxidoreductase n=1 Tax=Kibdelosporangium persicum TaxID=2698649 RepID=A0ABX2FHV2_9PSEU|nr:LLM class flavin-dependent oxidoreductase [Kibdelosporangium persicum]NRN70988.1 LLM class flavin-dependent oxidoreductase [Kibdelosporangium persicum]
MTTRLGVLVLPEHPGRTGLEVWQRVEAMGFAHAWTLDHLSWRTLRDRPWFDAMTTLAAAAVVTSRIGIGTLVTSPNFRSAVVTAKQAMTLDHLSEGRFTLGAGAGGPPPDSTALGGPELSLPERTNRFEEFVTLLDRLLRHPVTTFQGRYNSADDVRMIPGCVQQPRIPLAIAGAGRRAMSLAAQFGQMWVTTGRPDAFEAETVAFDRLRGQMERLRGGGLRKLVNLSRIVADPYSSPQRLTDLVGRCAALGFTDVVLAHPRAEGVYAGDPRAFERAVLPLLPSHKVPQP